MKNAIPFGVVTMAFGHRKYFLQAEALALSMRYHMPNIPIAIVTDNIDACSIFDYKVPLDPSHGRGVVQKVWLNVYTPFRETLFVDADCLVTRSFNQELAEISKYDFTPVGDKYLNEADRDDINFYDIRHTLNRLGAERLPRFNGGVYFWRDGDKADKIFELAKEFTHQADDLRIKTFDRAGINDEIAFGLALAQLNVRDIYDDRGRLMCTPIGLTGLLEIDVLGGGCHFTKYDRYVSPAICHFAAPHDHYAIYAFNCFLIRHLGIDPRLRKLAPYYFQAKQRFGHHYYWTKKRIRDRLESLRPKTQ